MRSNGLTAKKAASVASMRNARMGARLAASEPQVLKSIGDESKRKGTNTLTSSKINAIIEAARARTKK